MTIPASRARIHSPPARLTSRTHSSRAYGSARGGPIRLSAQQSQVEYRIFSKKWSCHMSTKWYAPAARRELRHVRLRVLLLRLQGGLPPALRGVLEPRQDALLAGGRHRSGDRPARGLPV